MESIMKLADGTINPGNSNLLYTYIYVYKTQIPLTDSSRFLWNRMSMKFGRQVPFTCRGSQVSASDCFEFLDMF